MRESIFQNIIQIQKESAVLANAKVGITDDLHWVMNEPSHWPNAIIGNIDEPKWDEIVDQIDQKTLPPFWIMDNQKALQQISYLEKHGFSEINRWEGMALDKSDFRPSAHNPEKYSLTEVVNTQLMDEWLSVVKPVMLPNKTLSESISSGWLARKEYIMVLGKEDRKPVSAGLAYIHKQCAGIYFIATLPEFQAKGYASFLVSNLINRCFVLGAIEIVLHASAMGKNIYQKIGFVSEGTISTYWKLGMI